jgi:hypothetical protein
MLTYIKRDGEENLRFKWRERCYRILASSFINKSGANLSIASYKATCSPQRFENKNIVINFEKTL